MIRLKQDYASEKFVDAGKFSQQDRFVNYDEIVLDKISVENKADFAQ
jgi:hypothetical protein